MKILTLTSRYRYCFFQSHCRKVFSSNNSHLIVIYSVCSLFSHLSTSQIRWMRRMTLPIELLTYGFVSLAFIFEVIERFVEVDAATSDKIEFIFLASAIGSTAATGLLNLIQILLLVKDIYHYVKNRRANKNSVHPIILSDLHSHRCANIHYSDKRTKFPRKAERCRR